MSAGNAKQKDGSQLPAEQYAPRGSSFTYGIVGVSLVGLVLIAFSALYSIDLLFNPKLLGGFLALVFLGGIALRHVRQSRNHSAFRYEYNKRSAAEGGGGERNQRKETSNVRLLKDRLIQSARQHSSCP